MTYRILAVRRSVQGQGCDPVPTPNADFAGLEARRMADGELGEDGGVGGGHLPAGAGDVFGVVAGVEAEAGYDHEDVFGVGVDGDPFAGAGGAVVGQLA